MRYNHGGYPRPRHLRPLHPCSLMTNLADTYDAMRSRRSYQEEFPPEKVASIINDRAGADFHRLLAGVHAHAGPGRVRPHDLQARHGALRVEVGAGAVVEERRDRVG